MKSNTKTYISLFSGAGIGCFGFKLEKFECIASNELLIRRLNIQKFNKKCKYETGYILGDITLKATKDKIFAEIDLWKKKENLKKVDVVIASPPCQGMSVANQKKTKLEIVRNSLVVESIKIIQSIKPRFFIFENVPAFMRTICTDLDGTNKLISEAIFTNLGGEYSYAEKIINFKNYGACSSRPRSLVIGVCNDYTDEISPLELFPDLVPEITLRETIGHLRPLRIFGEISPQDIYHSFRIYPEHMRDWISDLKEGESAFNNVDEKRKPHQIINGRIVINQQKNSDKYKRQYWNRVGPCIHTRNDQLASQNTIHPEDDRVFSVRELMLMMTIPNSFNWVEKSSDLLNNMADSEKKIFLKKEEMNIRQSLGEAVPTAIFLAVAKKINEVMSFAPCKASDINKIVKKYQFNTSDNLIGFINKNPLNLSISALGRIAELSNTYRTDNAAYFTNKSLVTEILKRLPDSDKDEIRILEPSVGVGNFIPLILKRFEHKRIVLDVVDIDNNSLRVLQTLLQKIKMHDNVTINYINDDFLLHHFKYGYDYIIGNPPFFRMKAKDKKLPIYRRAAKNKETTNICSFFLDKAVSIGEYLAIILPKFILNTPEFKISRGYLSEKSIETIIDFGEKGFHGVLIETVALLINNRNKPKNTLVVSITKRLELFQPQKYIFEDTFPYWIIYRNAEFDRVRKKVTLGVFTVFRDRQITSKMLKLRGDIRVIKSRNISDNGTKIVDMPGYDAYINRCDARNLSVYKYLNNNSVYLAPNMTYYPRLMRKPKNTLVNGSVAILIANNRVALSLDQLLYISTEEFRYFYQIARNYQTRSLNIDSCSVYFFGLLHTRGAKNQHDAMEHYCLFK